MAESDRSRGRIPALDGLRALAIIGVLCCHVNNKWDFPFEGAVSEPASVLLGWGWVGVYLFFVLSLITGILWETKGEACFFRNFYARRALRIMPLYYGYLLLTLVVMPLVLAVLPARAAAFLQAPAVSRGDILSLVFYFANIRIAFTGRFLGIFHPFWSLAVEEHFYLLWPLAVWSLGRRNLMRLCLGGAVASMCLRGAIIFASGQEELAQLITPGALDGLFAGGWLALARGHQSEWAPMRKWALPVLVGSGGFLLSLMLGQMHVIRDWDPRINPGSIFSGMMFNTIGITAMAVCFTALTARALDASESSWLRRALEHRGLVAIGKYSYGIYVFHPLILIYVFRLIAVRFAPYAPVTLIKLIAIAGLLAVTFLVARLSYYGYEIHFLRLKRFFEPRPRACSDFLAAPQSQEA